MTKKKSARQNRLVMYNSPVSCRVFIPLVLSFLLFCPPAPAQSAGKAKLSYKLLSIHVKGLDHFKDDQIITASGLKLGQFAGEDEFKQAAQKLGETGLFSNLTYSYQYSPAGCNLELQVAENDKLVPIVFDNFVWFSDEELVGLLHSRLPLFEGRLPLGGSLADQVSDSLNAILAERKISGQAEYLNVGRLNGPIDSYVYRVRLHPIVVRKTDFPGAAGAEILPLQAAAEPLMGQDYLRTKMRPQEKLNFLPVYLARGYLKATFADAQAKVAEDGAQTLVDVSFPVTPGLQYTLTAIQWSGNAVFPADKLQELIHLKTGEPANAVQLNQDLDQIHNLYGTQGYLFAEVAPTPVMDDTHSAVSYQLNVSEGDLYRMGELQMDGLDPQASNKIAAQWQMKKGDAYDNSYLPRFFKTMYRDVGLHGSYNVVPKQSVNQQDKTVSVTLHFMPKG
jgi:outer membrane protein assembly factor BamA